MQYHTIFDISQTSSRQALMWEIIPLLTLVPGFIGWALKSGSKDTKTASKGNAFMLISGFAFVISLVGLIRSVSEHRRVQKQMKDGSYQVVEGTVQEFIPMPPGGHSIESFKVGATAFSYSYGSRGDVRFNSGFNHGYIRDGAAVRIAYDGRDILRVDVRQKASTPD